MIQTDVVDCLDDEGLSRQVFRVFRAFYSDELFCDLIQLCILLLLFSLELSFIQIIISLPLPLYGLLDMFQ